MNEFQPSRILDHLYISGILGVTTKNLHDRNIRFVINLTVDTEEIVINGVEFFTISIDDDPTVEIFKYFDQCAGKIKAALDCGFSVLVHCMAGVSRSATICIAYLMKYEGMTLLQAYKHLKHVRPQVRPNTGFFEQLIAYEALLYKGKNTVEMVDSPMGMVPDVYKAEQNSPLGYFISLESKDETIEPRESLITLDSRHSDSGNDADDEGSSTTLASSST